MYDKPEPTEFSGVAGLVLRNAVSMSSLATGLVLAFILFVGNWVLLKAGAPNAITPFTQILFAFAMARFALNGMYGEWGGTVFSSEGGPWSRVGLIGFRYLTLTAIWLVPLLMFGLREDQLAPLLMMGPAAAGKAMTILGFYMLASILTPPLFLIIATRAEGLGDLFSPELWRSTFGGRFGDLLAIYAVYVGGVVMVCVLSLPVIMLGFSAGKAPGVLGAAGAGCLLLGVSTNLLGRLCGFFACGESGLGAPSVQTTVAVQVAPQPMPAVNRAPVATSLPVADSAPVVPFGAPAAALGPTPAGGAPAVATSAAPASQLPPLMDAQERVTKLMERFANESEVVLAALEDLHRSYAPSPVVVQALVVARNRTGQADAARALGEESLPLCFERGNIHLAAAIYRELWAHAQTLPVSRDQVLQIAAALHKMNDLSAAAKTYGSVLGADPGDTRAIKGMLQVGDQILEKTQRPDQAAKVYRYLLAHCGKSPLVEYMQQGLEEAERRMR